MQPLRIRISRIVDFGTVVSLVGIDSETAMAVSVHVDYRPFASVRQAWRDAGLPQPIEYAADRLMLHLDMLPAADADEVRLIEDGLIEDDGSVRSPRATTRAVRELDQ